MSASWEIDGYRLLHNARSSVRLNLQHYIWSQVCGFYIHPRVAPSKESRMKVADVGTGTGIWIADVKQRYPNLEIDGFDISLNQCPPSEFLPQGCSIRQLDIRADLPEDLRGVYDIVNMRLFIAAIKGTDLLPVLINIMTMLKPGGHIQWQEINLATVTVVSARPEMDRTILEAILHELQNMSYADWTQHLAQLCTEQGMLDAWTDQYRVPPEYRVAWSQTQFGACEEISLASYDNSSPDAEGPRFRKLLDSAYPELIKGVTLQHELEVTVARKAA